MEKPVFSIICGNDILIATSCKFRLTRGLKWKTLDFRKSGRAQSFVSLMFQHVRRNTLKYLILTMILELGGSRPVRLNNNKKLLPVSFRLYRDFHYPLFYLASNFERLLKVSKGPLVTKKLLIPGEIFPPGLTSNK